ncbi:RHS repeat-associated core domain-containing protein, partial [Variovorax sp. CCNWLW186]|uniref:RHS repeat-associated core domain-containing protein n=1 Tax=Variovorax sp. CCNWLW186 TaxID=3127473 RepID=UPI003078893D
SGQAVWQWSYSAFGEDKPTIAKNRFANLDITPNPGTTSVSEVKFNLRYPGQYADEESGLSYNYFRSYDPRTGRYPQGDPIGLGGGWNRFNYVDGNPLGATDPRGLQTVRGPRGIPIPVGPSPVPQGGSYDPEGIPIPPPALSWPQSRPISPLDFTIPGMIQELCKGIGNRVFSTPSPFLPGDPYSPESVDGRRSRLRGALGTGNLDPDSPIPDQGPGRDMGGHEARGRTPHDTGERNVNSHEEHSIKPKGNNGPRR